jgi:hypothetical protein
MAADLEHILNIAEPADPVALAEIRRRLRLWESGKFAALHVALGVRRYGAQCRKRNAWLREAARYLPGSPAPSAAALLLIEADRQMARRDPRRRLDDVEAALVRAKQHGAFHCIDGWRQSLQTAEIDLGNCTRRALS